MWLEKLGSCRSTIVQCQIEIKLALVVLPGVIITSLKSTVWKKVLEHYQVCLQGGFNVSEAHGLCLIGLSMTFSELANALKLNCLLIRFVLAQPV